MMRSDKISITLEVRDWYEVIGCLKSMECKENSLVEQLYPFVSRDVHLDCRISGYKSDASCFKRISMEIFSQVCDEVFSKGREYERLSDEREDFSDGDIAF